MADLESVGRCAILVDMSDAPEKSQGANIRAVITGAVLLAVLSFSVGAIAGSSRNTVAAAVIGAGGVYSPPDGVDFTPVWKAWSVIDERYVPSHVATTTSTSTASSTPTGATDPQQRVWGMIEGLAQSIGDPYTVFMPPVQAKIFSEDISGDFEGVGMEIAIRDNILTVVSPLKNSPASRAGLKAGDRILKIDDTDTRGITINAAVSQIRGVKGTKVNFTILRDLESDVLKIDVVRDVINIPTIDTERRPDGIFVIRLYNFSAVSAGMFRTALREFIGSGSTKMILDLRGNPGGYLEASVDIASWFLPQGSIVVTEDYASRQSDIVHRSRGYDVFNKNLRMVILVDRGSASASEILAGALKHYGIAKLVGVNTFGKGSVQELVEITSETSLKITVARWLNPGGVQIPNEGIAPDVEIKVSKEDAEAGKDPQLNKAIEILLNI